MTETNLTRRKFMAVSSAAIASPFVIKMTGTVTHSEAAAKENETKYNDMKSIVIYYSQTGNTKKIGQAIQKGITRQTGQCDLVRVKEITPAKLEKYDLIGIGAPTWSSCPSPIVIYFCKNLPPTLKGKHFFWYSTHGTMPGRCIIRGVQPLKEAGMTVIGWKDWYCGCKVPGHMKPWYTDGHPDEIDLAEAESFGEAMVEHSRIISDGETGIIPTLHSTETSDQIWGKGHPFVFMGAGQQSPAPDMDSNMEVEKMPYPLEIPTSMNYVCELEGMPNREGAKSQPGNELKINPDKCIRCGLCVKGCPCYNIDDSVFPYVFKTQDCEMCLFCEGICPTGAIEFEFRKPDQNAGKGDSGMADPGKGGGDISLQLELAEATGRFRRLTRREDVGPKTWEEVTGHPRHKELP
ncbi:MAG: 4Fe-4S binding protein [Deltaproteobacteria bacterium]|nr:4Fe-4S binding protein [Deltaproteobacteria bacterium]